jgi:hypothetical protein
VFFAEESGLPAPMAAHAVRAKREYDRTIERVVREGIEAGRLRPMPANLVVFGILGMCNWLHKWYKPQGPLGPAQIADVFVDLLERGYLAEHPPTAARSDDALTRIERRLARLESAVSQPRRRPPRRP